MPLLRRHPLRTSLGIVGWMIAGTVAAQAPAATPASAPAVGTAASSSPALRWSPLLNFQRVLDRPDRPQPQHRLAYGSAAQQFGELWLPSPERFGRGPYPVVLLVHGGCWMAELPGPELLAWQAEALREQGLAVWSISYRRVGHEGGGYPGTFKDVALAADHLRELAKNYPLDLSRVTASGHSAGGHLALWLAARPGLPAGSPLHTAAPLPVHGVVSVAGVGDLAWAAPFLSAVCSPDIIAKLALMRQQAELLGLQLVPDRRFAVKGKWSRRHAHESPPQSRPGLSVEDGLHWCPPGRRLRACPLVVKDTVRGPATCRPGRSATHTHHALPDDACLKF